MTRRDLLRTGLGVLLAPVVGLLPKADLKGKVWCSIDDGSWHLRPMSDQYPEYRRRLRVVDAETWQDSNYRERARKSPFYEHGRIDPPVI